MATYCVIPGVGDNWGEPPDRFKTRRDARVRFELLERQGLFVRMIRWEHHLPTEVARANEHARPAQRAEHGAASPEEQEAAG